MAKPTSKATTPDSKRVEKVPVTTPPATKPIGARSEPAPTPSSFGLMRRFAADLDRFFGDVGTSLAAGFDVPSLDAAWKPVVEVSERGGNLVIRAELPGLAVKDVKVELRDDALMIQGERRQEREQKGKGYFRSERSYGSFLRQIPVPEGTTPASVKATFKDGVLEVTMPAPTRPAKGHNVAIEKG